MHDVCIANGLVVDGTGEPPRRADVVIDGDRIVELAEPGTAPPATTTIDATDRVVTPGFIDPHTHLDAQLWWDATGAPSLLHGVTSVVLGSCGFGVAPARAGTEEYLLRSLEAVEEIPYASTRGVVPFTWGSWGDFLGRIGELELGVNVGGLVPHSNLRYAVMGEAALTGPADAAQLRALTAALDAGLEAGALGFSSSRGTNHTDASGNPMASRQADDRELEALVARCRDRVWQINIKAKGASDAAGAQAAVDEIETYLAWSRDHGTRFTWTPLVVAPTDRGAWQRLLEHNRSLEQPDRVAPQVIPQSIVSSITFDGPSFANMVDGWSEPFAAFGGSTDAERRARLADPGFRRAIAAAPTDCHRVTGICYERWTLAISPSRPELVGANLAQLGEELGAHPAVALADLALADELATVVEVPLSNLDHDAVSVLATDPSTMLGLGDAGAHVRTISNYSYPTFVLSRLVRDEGRLELAAAVRKLTGQPARMLGIEDRGVLQPGALADVNVIDLDRLQLAPAELVGDLPGGAKRMSRLARGYSSVLVNGQVVVEGDQLTDRRPGRLLRAA